MDQRRNRQRDLENTYEFRSIGFGPTGYGWSMASRHFHRCPTCGYLMQGGVADEDCFCGNLRREPGRFGAGIGDASIEVFEARHRRTGEYP